MAQPSRPECTGPLKRKSKNRYETAFFELKGKELCYFAERQTRCVRHRINLAGAQLEDGKDPSSFTLTCPGLPDPLQLRADTPFEKRRWCRALLSVLETPNPIPPPPNTNVIPPLSSPTSSVSSLGSSSLVISSQSETPTPPGTPRAPRSSSSPLLRRRSTDAPPPTISSNNSTNINTPILQRRANDTNNFLQPSDYQRSSSYFQGTKSQSIPPSLSSANTNSSQQFKLSNNPPTSISPTHRNSWSDQLTLPPNTVTTMTSSNNTITSTLQSIPPSNYLNKPTSNTLFPPNKPNQTTTSVLSINKDSQYLSQSLSPNNKSPIYNNNNSNNNNKRNTTGRPPRPATPTARSRTPTKSNQHESIRNATTPPPPIERDIPSSLSSSSSSSNSLLSMSTTTSQANIITTNLSSTVSTNNTTVIPSPTEENDLREQFPDSMSIIDALQRKFPTKSNKWQEWSKTLGAYDIDTVEDLRFVKEEIWLTLKLSPVLKSGLCDLRQAQGSSVTVRSDSPSVILSSSDEGPQPTGGNTTTSTSSRPPVYNTNSDLSTRGSSPDSLLLDDRTRSRSPSPSAPDHIMTCLPPRISHPPIHIRRQSESPSKLKLTFDSLRSSPSHSPVASEPPSPHACVGEAGGTMKDIRIFDSNAAPSDFMTLALPVPFLRSPDNNQRLEDSPIIDTQIFISAFIHKWDSLVRQVNVTIINNYEDLLTSVYTAFPELREFISGFGIVRNDQTAAAYDPIDAKTFTPSLIMPNVDSHCIVIVPRYDLCLRDLYVDCEEEHPVQIELRYFTPNYASLLSKVHECVPLTRKFLVGMHCMGQDGSLNDITPEMDWNQVMSCSAILVISAFVPENKQTILQRWAQTKRNSPLISRPINFERIPSCSVEIIKDRVKGGIYGMAIGASLGLSTKWMTSEAARKVYSQGDIMSIRHSIFKDAPYGEKWNEKMDQLFVMMSTLLQQPTSGINISDLACSFMYWTRAGIPEVGHASPDEVHLGYCEKTVVEHGCFLMDPQFASDCVWQQSGCQTISNGALWRTVPISFIHFCRDENLITDTLEVAKMTHSDPRCQAASVAVNLAIQGALVGLEFGEVLQKCQVHVFPLVEDKLALSKYLWTDELLDMDIDDHENLEDIYKPMGCALWSLKSVSNGTDFSTIVRSVVMEAGDSDCNAAIAGAVAGSRVGFTQMQKSSSQWIDMLNYREWMSSKIELLFATLGL